MAKVISIRDEFFATSGKATLQAVINSLSSEFLLIPLNDYHIEVDEQDYSAVIEALTTLRQHHQSNPESL